MASATMMAIAQRNAMELEELEQAKQKVNDKVKDDEPATKPPQSANDDIKDDDFDDDDYDDGDDFDDGDNQPQDPEPNPSDDDFETKYNRIKNKMSGVEKTKAEQANEIALLRAQLETKAQQDTNTPKKQSAGSEVTDDDVRAYLTETMGDKYEYMDESSQHGFEVIAKRTLELERQISSGGVDKAVERKLQEQAQNNKRNEFSKDMDSFIKSIDPDLDSDFTQIVNEQAFDDYLKSNTAHRAFFIEASKNLNDDTHELMKQVVSGYLGAPAPAPRKSNSKKAPNIGNSERKPNNGRGKRPKYSPKQIAQAEHNLKIPSMRAQATKLLDEAERLGLY